MYNPETFLTKDLLLDVLHRYNWGDEYAIYEEDISVDGIKVRFSKCVLFFREGFESEISLYISDPSSKEEKYWSSFDLINNIFAPLLKEEEKFKEPEYLDSFFPFASKEKVIVELNNLCIAIQSYLMNCLLGDFSDVKSNNS